MDYLHNATMYKLQLVLGRLSPTHLLDTYIYISIKLLLQNSIAYRKPQRFLTIKRQKER